MQPGHGWTQGLMWHIRFCFCLFFLKTNYLSHLLWQQGTFFTSSVHLLSPRWCWGNWPPLWHNSGSLCQDFPNTSAHRYCTTLSSSIVLPWDGKSSSTLYYQSLLTEMSIIFHRNYSELPVYCFCWSVASSVHRCWLSCSIHSRSQIKGF